MQKVACPGCGAEVGFRSAASVMAVCEYCRTAVLKDAATVRDIGKIAPVFEDYSPLQINASGRLDKTGFTVVGRLQLKYGAGYWNEWRVLLDDGTEAWLSDASGQYVFTFPRTISQSLPKFADLRPGVGCNFSGNRYIASDVREARCVAGEGELPFAVGDGWVLKAADFRWRDRFLTFDYSESDTPAVYAGRSVTLDELHCQLLRTPDDVKDAAGRYRGATVPLNCPGCGNGIEYRTGMATHVVCPACHAEVDCGGEKAEVLAKHGEVEQVATTLKAGDEGKIGEITWTVIGLACHKELEAEATSTWVEYLLFNAKLGLMWLVESGDGWSRVKVLDTWPEPAGTDQRFVGDVYEKLYDYVGEVTYAAGNFNWQVQVGDRVSITDYGHGDKRLSAEKSDAEITWSHAQRVDTDEVLKWFGKSEADAEAGAAYAVGATQDEMPAFAAGWPMWTAWVMLVLFNFNLLFGEEDGLAMLIVILAAWLIYLPVQIANKFRGGHAA
jgi:ribosomal protein S27E